MKSRALGEILEHAGRTSALVMGPGTGTGDEGRRLLEGILREVELPVLLDADAITNLAGTDVLARREAPTVITPHAGELGRLLGSGARRCRPAGSIRPATRPNSTVAAYCSRDQIR